MTTIVFFVFVVHVRYDTPRVYRVSRARRLSAPVIVKKLVIRKRRDGAEENPEKELLKRKAHSEDVHHADKLALSGKFPLAKRERRYFIDEREKEKIHACLEDSPNKP